MTASSSPQGHSPLRPCGPIPGFCRDPLSPSRLPTPEPHDSAEELIEAARRRRAEAEEAAPPPAAKRRAAQRKRTTATEAGTEQAAIPDGAPEAHLAAAARRLGPWGLGALAAGIALLVASTVACCLVPEPPAPAAVRVRWLAGPRLPDAEVVAWVAAFPMRRQLAEPNRWVLDKLAEHLRAQPAVQEVQAVRLENERVAATGRLQRVLAVELGLRRPELPAVLADGRRAWIAGDGRLLPGQLPGPSGRLPLVRGVERGSALLAEAVGLWRELGPRLEPGLVIDLKLDAPVDELGTTGIVLRTRQGSLLVWGHPDDERTGPQRDEKVRALAHAIRCQGDLGRIASINVRFAQPTYTLR